MYYKYCILKIINIHSGLGEQLQINYTIQVCLVCEIKVHCMNSVLLMHVTFNAAIVFILNLK